MKALKFLLWMQLLKELNTDLMYQNNNKNYYSSKEKNVNIYLQQTESIKGHNH